ncbi:MAG: ureidoglycolate lyase [Candidatus Marinimicrobia bacterium]|nr:ureidoglycolate lyase [Candidatus Neomarinimicrobiota bacterium]MCF7850922.1 ureidoglycolate lyase [Candidatus Neomarinimicrobiota bacterium]
MSVKVVRATREAFQAYGKFVTLDESTVTSEGDNYVFWSDIASYEIKGETEVGICQVFRDDPLTVDTLERHERTPEVLIPIDGSFILPLKLDGDGNSVQAFEVAVGEAVVINEGVWHGACVPLSGKACSYFVIFKRGTPDSDVQKQTTTPVEIFSR